MEEAPTKNLAEFLGRKIFRIIDTPVTWFRETIVVPNRKPIYYYHKNYRRVPSIDECYEEDALCMYEANEQFKRDRQVEAEIVSLLRERKVDCYLYEGFDANIRCKKICDDYEGAALNFFIKYGDLGSTVHVKQAYMKQKHRMVYERRKAEGKLDSKVKL